MTADKLELGAIYRHYKGGLYKIIEILDGINGHYSGKDKQVLYSRISDNTFWSRSAEEFLSDVTDKMSGVVVQRFVKVSPVLTWETQLLDIYKDLLLCENRMDRTGTGTLADFGKRIVIDLSKGFPLVTTKYVNFRSVAAELLWFLEGSSDERRLCEIQHGTRDNEKNTIWTANAEHTTGSGYKPRFQGDLGRVYGVQWRSWKRPDGSTVDQVQQCVDKLTTNPTDRAIIVSALNVGELDQMMIRPCHLFCQFYRTNDNKLDCQVYIRSWDTFLGAPYNIASYALLTHMMAHVVGAGVGTLIVVSGDTHIYRDHVEQVNEQLKRQPYKPPTLTINRQVYSIDDFKLEDFAVTNYEHYPAIKATMSQ